MYQTFMRRGWIVESKLLKIVNCNGSRQRYINTTANHMAGATLNPTIEEDPNEDIIRNHIPTSHLQKWILGFGSAAMGLKHPERDDMVAIAGEITGVPALKYMKKKMMNDPVGRQILEEKPRVNTSTLDLDWLKSLPDDTYGKAYYNFLELYDLNPDDRYPVHFVDDMDLAYIMQRYREAHDLFHTLLGMPTHMLGEVLVKWVEGLQLGLPLGFIGGFLGAARLGPKHRKVYLQTHLWWALRNGMNAKFLMNCYYEKHWEMSIHELRKRMNIEEPPKNTPSKMR